MTKFSIQVNDTAIQAKFAELSSLTTNLRPALTDIGEALKIQIDRYFATQTGPDGVRWSANMQSTIDNYVKSRGGVSKKTGKQTSKGQLIKAQKKVLQGITGELRRTIYWNATQDALIVGSPKPYAVLQNFGGQFKAWGKTIKTMPARPFMPVDKNNNLYPAAQSLILKRLDQHLSQLK